MSPDLHDVLIAAIPSIIPTVMVGFGILVNKSDSNRLGGEINTIRGEISSLRARVDAMNEKFDARLAAISEKFDARLAAMSEKFHADIINLINIGNELDKRVSRIEDKI